MKPTESFVFGLAPGATPTNVRFLCARDLLLKCGSHQGRADYFRRVHRVHCGR